VSALHRQWLSRLLSSMHSRRVCSLSAVFVSGVSQCSQLRQRQAYQCHWSLFARLFGCCLQGVVPTRCKLDHYIHSARQGVNCDSGVTCQPEQKYVCILGLNGI
jgi:hypothetical protein